MLINVGDGGLVFPRTAWPNSSDRLDNPAPADACVSGLSCSSSRIGGPARVRCGCVQASVRVDRAGLDTRRLLRGARLRAGKRTSVPQVAPMKPLNGMVRKDSGAGEGLSVAAIAGWRGRSRHQRSRHLVGLPQARRQHDPGNGGGAPGQQGRGGAAGAIGGQGSWSAFSRSQPFCRTRSAADKQEGGMDDPDEGLSWLITDFKSAGRPLAHAIVVSADGMIPLAVCGDPPR